MHPAFHSHVAALGLVTTTTSPTWMLSAGKNHFGLDPICGKYSCMHCCQTCLTSFCTLHQHVLGLKGLVSKLSGTKSPTISPIRKWFGVNQIRSPKMHTGKVDFHLLTDFNSILSNAIKFITHRENAWLNIFNWFRQYESEMFRLFVSAHRAYANISINFRPCK